jgi:hypothetical protein
MTDLPPPSRESRDLAMHRVNAHDYANVDDFIQAVHRLAMFIEHGVLVNQPQPQLAPTVTNVMNVR